MAAWSNWRAAARAESPQLSPFRLDYVNPETFPDALNPTETHLGRYPKRPKHDGGSERRGRNRTSLDCAYAFQGPASARCRRRESRAQRASGRCWQMRFCRWPSLSKSSVLHRTWPVELVARGRRFLLRASGGLNRRQDLYSRRPASAVAIGCTHAACSARKQSKCQRRQKRPKEKRPPENVAATKDH